MANLSAIRKVVNNLREKGIILAIVGDGQLTVHTTQNIVIPEDAKRFIKENRSDIILALLQEQRETTTPIGDHDQPYTPTNAVTDADLAKLGMKPDYIRFMKWWASQNGRTRKR